MNCEPTSCKLEANELQVGSQRVANCEPTSSKLPANELRVYHIVSQRVANLPDCNFLDKSVKVEVHNIFGRQTNFYVPTFMYH